MLLGNYDDIMVYKVTNSEFTLQGEINQFSQVSWKVAFTEAGEVEIKAPITTENISLLNKNSILWAGKNSAAVIESRNIEKNQNGDRTITIKGKTLESILSRRAIDKPISFKNKKLSTVLYGIVDAFCIFPDDESRVIPYLELATDEGLGPTITIQKTGGSVLEALTEICLTTDNIGFEIRFVPQSTKLLFKVFEAKDRTVNQQINSPVVFSDDMEDIYSDTYYESFQDYKNIAYIFGEGEGQDRISTMVGDDVSGFDRYELYVDARDLQKDADSENPLTDEEYLEVLQSRGYERLGENREVQTYEGSLRLIGNPNYTFGVDYNLGDKVTVEDKELALEIDATVQNITEYYSSSYDAQVQFGYGVPKLKTKIRNMVR